LSPREQTEEDMAEQLTDGSRPEDRADPVRRQEGQDRLPESPGPAQGGSWEGYSPEVLDAILDY